MPQFCMVFTPSGISAFTLIFTEVYAISKGGGPVTGETHARALGGFLKKKLKHSS